MAALLGLGVLSAVFVLMWFWINTTPATGEQKTTAHLEVFKTTASVAVSLGGVGALYLAARRQRTQEAEHAHAVCVAEINRLHAERVAAATEDDAARRRVTELYTKAADQLGSDKAPVRLAGLYALERLGQDNPDQRPTIANLWCAYLRMPYTPPPPAVSAAHPSVGVTRPLLRDPGRRIGIRPPASSATGPEPKAPHAETLLERDVRLSVQRLLAKHLRPCSVDLGEPDRDYWREIPSLDLTDATLIDLDFHQCVLPSLRCEGATFTRAARFDRVTFSGQAAFNGATFSSYAEFDGAAFTRGAQFDDVTFIKSATFELATFAELVAFKNAIFASIAKFGGSTFIGYADFENIKFAETATFDGASFAGDALFDGATFANSAQFRGATFAGDASFNNARFDGDALFKGGASASEIMIWEPKADSDIWKDATFTGRATFFHAIFIGSACFCQDASTQGPSAWRTMVRLDVPETTVRLWPPRWVYTEPPQAQAPGVGVWGELMLPPPAPPKRPEVVGGELLQRHLKRTQGKDK